MASACCGRRCSFAWPAWASAGARCSTGWSGASRCRPSHRALALFDRRAAAWLWREHRRFFIGLAVLLAGTGVLLAYLPELQAVYRELQAMHARDTPALYLSVGGLMLLAALTSVFPASILGVLAGVLFGVVKGFLLSAAAFMLAAL